MAEVKRILIVDDHFETVGTLRSMLRSSGRHYEVLGVPSAEEGLLELRQKRYDLLVTGVLLPGMSGFDLMRKVKRFELDLPSIMITGKPSHEDQKQAAELGVARYFQKPLDTNRFLAAVRAILHSSEAEIATAPLGERRPVGNSQASPKVRSRLETLCSETGALQVMLATTRGDILVTVGSTEGFDLSGLAIGIAANVDSSFQLADQIGDGETFTIMYQAGQHFDLYSANIGRDFIMAILFDARARRGRIGTVWVFAQRAIKDLKTYLAEPAFPLRESAPEISQFVPNANDSSPTKVTKETAVETDAAEVEVIEPLSIADLQEMLGVELPELDEDIDLDSYWGEAQTDTASGDSSSSSISFEEALKQGLISSEFDPSDESSNDYSG